MFVRGGPEPRTHARRCKAVRESTAPDPGDFELEIENAERTFRVCAGSVREMHRWRVELQGLPWNVGFGA